MEILDCGPNRNKSDQILGKGFTTKPRANKTLQSQTCTRSTLRTSGTPPEENHRVSTESPALVRPVSLTGQTGPAQKPQSGENTISRNQNCTKLEQQLSLDDPSSSAQFPLENPNLTCTGQTGVSLGPREKQSREQISIFSSPDLPIYSTDSSETLGILGVPHGHPVAKRSSPKTH